MDFERVRRGVKFAGVSLLLSILILPFAVNAILSSPPVGLGQTLLWIVILSLTAAGFYAGYTGWGE